jgi:osmoprotectant transport system permease protein
VTALTGILYTIPSLAAFALLVPVFSFSWLTAFIPLTTYTLLILFRNIVAGLDGVPADVLEAADAMGYHGRQRLLRVELPLAVPMTMAGIRLAAVTLIGLATVVSILGSSFGGLGLLITEGLQTFFPTKYLLGGLLSIVLALVVDWLLVRSERWLTPWAHPAIERGAGA